MVKGKEKAKKKTETERKKIFVDKYNLGGRPPSFRSVNELIEKATDYFAQNECVVIGHTKNGTEIRGQAPINLQGLCDFLGITNQTLNEYGKKEEYAYTVSRIKKKCEKYLVDLCCLSKDHKADFILKNSYKDDWKDETLSKLSGGVNVVVKKYNWEDDDNNGDTNSKRLESARLSTSVVESPEQRG